MHPKPAQTVVIPQVVAPSVHMNGTSQKSLLDSRGDAYDALNKAYEVLKQTAPNGRDYYVSDDPKSLERATEQHMARLRAIQSVMDSLESEMDLILQQEG